jgi:hypothetical protein
MARYLRTMAPDDPALRYVMLRLLAEHERDTGGLSLQPQAEGVCDGPTET